MYIDLGVVVKSLVITLFAWVCWSLCSSKLAADTAAQKAYKPRFGGDSYELSLKLHESVYKEVIRFNKQAETLGVAPLSLSDIQNLSPRDIARLTLALRYKVDAAAMDGPMVQKTRQCGKAIETYTVEE